MRPTRIVIADEHPESGRRMQTVLVRAGYSVPLVVSDARGLLARGLVTDPDLVLMSSSLPGEPDALETARRLRAERDTLVLLLAPEGYDVSLNRAGAPLGLAYLVRPVTDHDLVDTVAKALAGPGTGSPRRGDARMLEQALAAVPDGIVLTDLAGSITFVNPSAARIMGWTPQQVLGSPLAELLKECTAAGIRETVPLEPADGSVIGSLHLLRDFSSNGGNPDREEETAPSLVRRHRLDGLGHLARGFSHDFNNLLTVLMGNLALARAQLAPGEVQRLLEEAESATHRARDLVEQLRTFAKGGEPIRGMLPLRPLVDDVLEGRAASSRITYHTHFDGPEITLEADPKQLRRLLENLLLNAEQSIAGAGEIHLHCSWEIDADENRSAVLIQVRDTGSGMSEETMAQAVEPFFTTRADQNATGLGLTVCDSIVRGHGGTLAFQAPPGQGTTVSVRLPLMTTGDAGSDPDPAPLRGWQARLNGQGSRSFGSPPRILVLEDESLIRRLIHSTLTQAGFQVDESREGREAVDAFREAGTRGEAYDLLIMDLTIENGMGGVEAMKLIREIDPDVPAIVSSGYSDDPAMARPSEYGFSSVLPKPYPPARLVETVTQILAGTETAVSPAATS